MSREISPDRLGDLLVDPREALDLELKNWLDLRGDRHHKAILAKAVMALANHGGGFILLGFEDGPDGVVEADNRPDAMTAYSQDVVNGIVEHYCEPSFHCEVSVEASPAGSEFPVVKVPGGHRVPVRAKRSGPGESVFRENDIYVRKPGPRSEVPRSAQEWDELLSRCLENRRDELASLMRRVLAGLEPRPQPKTPMNAWIGGRTSASVVGPNRLKAYRQMLGHASPAGTTALPTRSWAGQATRRYRTFQMFCAPASCGIRGGRPFGTRHEWGLRRTRPMALWNVGWEKTRRRRWPAMPRMRTFGGLRPMRSRS